MTARTTSDTSVFRLLGRYRWRVALTMALVLIEAAAWLLFPLFIGFAVDGLVDDDLTGVIALAALGLGALTVGSLRRLYDTRTYSRLYEEVASETVEREREAGSPVTSMSARANLLREMVEFLENSMPELVNGVIGVVGALVILIAIDTGVFLASLGLLMLVLLVYGLTGRLNLRFNAGYNDELERQVDSLASDATSAKGHFHRLMRWNIRLSDLETANYAVIFLGVVALMFYAPIALVTGDAQAGAVIAALMYVLQYIEGLLTLPLYAQQAIRLAEISKRLTEPAGSLAPVEGAHDASAE